MSIFNWAARAAAPMALAAMLAACGDSEPDQRKAFIAFLQEINGRTGVHILLPSADEQKSFGPYAQHYAIFTDYNKSMSAQVNDFNSRIGKLGVGPGSPPRTIEQMAAAPQDLVAVKADIEKIEQAIEAGLAKVTADRAALTQPADLKAVFDRTFDKLVTKPTVAMEKADQTMDVGLDAAIKLVDYINSHRTKLTVSGMQIQAKDQRTLNEVQPLLKAHQDAGERFVEAQREAERVVEGD